MEPAVKRQVLRAFTYGMYILTCREGEDTNAFTVNWVTQASFEPPLIAVSVEKLTKSLPMIERTRRFAVNVLRTGQRPIAAKLGKSALKHPDKMAESGVAFQDQEGFLVVEEALGWVGCEVRSINDAGDSMVIIAEVTAAGTLHEDTPLTMLETGFKHAG